jgi:hypothetical protein
MPVHLKAYGYDSTEMHSVMLPEQISQKPTFNLFCILACQSLPVALHGHVSLLHITPCPCGLHNSNAYLAVADPKVSR